MTTFRRPPQQKRSHSLVNDVMEATAKLIPDFGYDRATTNRIAALAGVSIGSLYRYFPNKEAIVVSLMQRIEDEHRQELHEALHAVRELGPQQQIQPVVSTIVEAVMRRRKLLMVLYSHAPQLGAMGYLLQSRQRFRQDIEQALQNIARERLQAEPAMAARMIVGAVYGVLEDLVQEDSAEDLVETVKKELAELFTRYLFQTGRDV